MALAPAWSAAAARSRATSTPVASVTWNGLYGLSLEASTPNVFCGWYCGADATTIGNDPLRISGPACPAASGTSVTRMPTVPSIWATASTSAWIAGMVGSFTSNPAALRSWRDSAGSYVGRSASDASYQSDSPGEIRPPDVDPTPPSTART